MLEKIGIIIFVLGLSMGNSESLVFPIITLLIGAALVLIGERQEGRDDA